MNQLFIHSHSNSNGILLGIGARRSKRCITLTEDEALELAYRLMSLARGGETRGFEPFPSPSPAT